MTDLAADVERSLVTIETVRRLSPIDGADAIELAAIRGWSVVVGKGQFRVGDSVLYFEIDSLLPLDDDRFAFLAPRGEKVVDGIRYHRLKTARMRGVYSQGLVMPIRDFLEVVEATVLPPGHGGFDADPDPNSMADFASLLKVAKFEEELPETASGPFPAHLIRKTSSERVQNLDGSWDAVMAQGPWLATEKVDGYSCSVVRDVDGELYVCGRNWRVRTPAAGDMPDVYWRAVRDFDLERRVVPGTGVQLEIYGEGVRGNPLRIDGIRIAIFAAYVNGALQPRHTRERPTWRTWMHEHAAPMHDLQLPATAAEAIEQVDGLRSLISPQRLAEGIVWSQADAVALPELGYRSTMKAISNKALMKAGG